MSNEKFVQLLDQLRTGVYMTDPQTHEILFMNQRMKDDYGLTDPPEGQTCWRTLQKSRDGPCSFCKIPQLLQSGEENRPIQWQEKSEKAGKTFENFDSLVRWGGRLVHMQQSYDITGVLRLQDTAERDPLCGVWNRGKGMELLSKCLEALGPPHSLLAAVLDLDDLKEVNRRFGHAEGDFLLTQTARLLQERLSEPDFLFRLGGDEFVVVLMDTSEKEGTRLLLQCREAMEQLCRERGKHYTVSYSFGLERASQEARCTASDLVALADGRMFAEKLRRRKDRQPEHEAQCARVVPSSEFRADYSSERLYDALVRSTDDYIYMSNMKTGVYHFSPAQVELLGLPGEVMRNPSLFWKTIIHPDDWPRFYQANMEIEEGKRDSHAVEFRARTQDGVYTWIRCRGHVVRDQYGEPSLFAGMMTILSKPSKVDPLTQLLNHQTFMGDIAKSITDERMERLAVVVLDVDSFRRINEVYSRAFGDQILKNLAQTIQSILPEYTWLYRLDNDRMGIIQIGATQERVQALYQLIQRHLESRQDWGPYELSVRLSAGCAFYPENGDTADTLYRYADYAVQYAKSHGRNRLAFFSAEIEQEKQRSLELIARLREAMSNGFAGFSLRYQPQVDAATGEMMGVETLMRWQDETGTFVSPSEFIPLMEENDLIYDASLWMIRMAMRVGKNWIAIRPGFSVSVNVSPLLLMEKRFLNNLQQLLREEDFPCRNLIVELTESCAVQNITGFDETFRRMRGMGIRVAMDDFGTGYSSLELLKCIPVDIVKIDQGFVRNILNSSFDATFISFVVALCHTVNIHVCLEGVETEEEYRMVRSMELDSIQGYLFGRPMMEAEITNRLAACPA